jgi:hypothetical protein
MPTDAQQHWLDKIAARNGQPGALAASDANWEAAETQKAAVLEKVSERLEGLREKIQQGEDYKLGRKGLKGLYGLRKRKAIESEDKTHKEADIVADAGKTYALSDEQREKLFAARQELVQVQDLLKEAKFSDQEIMDEFWTPLVRERLIPDNAVPAQYSQVERMFKGAADAYVDKLKELDERRNRRKEMSTYLGFARDGIDVLGNVAQAVEFVVPGCPALAGPLTSGIQGALTAGIGVLQGGLDADCDKVVDGVAGVLLQSLSFYSPELGRLVAATFRMAGKGVAMADEFRKAADNGNILEGIGPALRVLGDGMADSMWLATRGTSAENPMILAGKATATALQAQEAVVTALIKRATRGEKIDGNLLLSAFVRAAATAAGGALEIRYAAARENLLSKLDAAEAALASPETSDEERRKAETEMEDALKEQKTAGFEYVLKAGEAAELAAETGAESDEAVARRKELEELKKGLTEEQAKLLKERANQKENEWGQDQIARSNADFQALLRDFLTEAEGPDPDLAEAAEVEHAEQTIERLIEQIERDRATLETFKLLCTALDITGAFVPQVAAAAALKNFAFNAMAAAERMAQLHTFTRLEKQATKGVSPIVDALHNRVWNLESQRNQHALLAMLQLTQATGAVLTCLPNEEAVTVGLALEKGALAAQGGVKVLYEAKSAVKLRRQWKLFQRALANPGNRRLARKTIRGNPTLSKYALAYGALVMGDPIAVRGLNQCGLSDEVLAHESSNVELVVKYLELLFDEDPKLYPPMPAELSFLPKGEEVELSVASWAKVKGLAIRKGGLEEATPTGALDGAFARWAKVEKGFRDQQAAQTLTEAHLTAALAALDELRDALGGYQPVTGKKLGLVGGGDEHKEMKQYAEDMRSKAVWMRGDLQRDFDAYQEERRLEREAEEEARWLALFEEFARVRNGVAADLETLTNADDGTLTEEIKELADPFKDCVAEANGDKDPPLADMKRLQEQVKELLRTRVANPNLKEGSEDYRLWDEYLRVRKRVNKLLDKVRKDHPEQSRLAARFVAATAREDAEDGAPYRDAAKELAKLERDIRAALLAG